MRNKANNITSSRFVSLNEISTPNPANNQTSAIYRVHGHWAKRPYNIVRKCIEHFSNTNEIVFDPFGGFGTTGIEALSARRKAVIIDLNPISVYISRMTMLPYSPNDLKEFEDEYKNLEKEVFNEISSLYRTECPKCGKEAIINITVYDSRNDEDDPRRRDYIPVKIGLSCSCEKRRYIYKKPSKKDYSEIERFEELEHSHWYPQKMLVVNPRINVHKGMTIADLYTPRNLEALSILHDAISRIPSGKVKELLRFTFSAILRSSSKMVHEGGGGWQNNFHIPKKGLAERNVWNIFARKKDGVLKSKREIWSAIGEYYREADDFSELEGDKTILIKKWDATELRKIVPDHSVDYVHTDPPYGDNIPYLELFLPHIYWLNLDSELESSVWHREIIVTDSPEFPDKDTKHYYELLTKSFVALGKVLKPNRWLTAWFACLDKDIWKALTDSFQLAGLEKKESYMIWRTSQQRSFSIKAREFKNPLSRVLKQDLLVHCQKTGTIKLMVPVPKTTALKIFLSIAENEIRRKGSATTGEIYIALVNECLRKFSSPPPNLRYEEVLERDPRFTLEEFTKNIKQNTVKTMVWRMKGVESPHRITYYMKE